MAATLGLEEESACLIAVSVHAALSKAVHLRGRTADVGKPLKPSLGWQQWDGGNTGKGVREKLLAGDAVHGRRINRARQGTRACEPTGYYPHGWYVLGDRQSTP